MVCITNCAIGAAFIGATIATTLASKQDKVFQEYHKTLNPEQKEILENITNQRLSLYIQGTILGIILVTIFMLFNPLKRMSSITGGCTFVAIVLLSQYFYYVLMPKQDWMILHLETKQQNEKWLNVYRHMSIRWHAGLLVGLLGFFLLGRGFTM